MPELGALQIGATLKEGRLTARLDAQSPEALRVLREHLSDLEAALVRQGLTVDLQVSSSDEQGAWQGRGDGQRSDDTGQQISIEPGIAVAAPALHSSTPLSAPTQRGKACRDHLDIHV